MNKFIKKNKELIIFLLLSFLIMLFCTTSSPLFYSNNWSDTNVYITMGRGLFQGKVLYLELFDHKGPLLYFLYGFSCFIFRDSYFSVYVLESIFFTLTLYYSYLISNIFLKRMYSYLAVFCLIPLIVNHRVFMYGGSAEEIIIPFMIISTYYSIKILKENYQKRNFYIVGVCFSSILLIKFTVAIYLFPFLLAILLLCLKTQVLKKVLLFTLMIILGVLTLFIPFIMYFVITKSLYEFVRAYIEFNFIYSGIELSISHIYTVIRCVYVVFKANYLEMILSCYGALSFIFNREFKYRFSNYIFLISWIITLLIICCCGFGFQYNFLSFDVFVLIGIIAVIKKLNFNNLSNMIFVLSYILLFIVSIYLNGNVIYCNSKLFRTDIDGLSILVEELKNEKNVTILEYKTPSLGIYNRLNIIPNVRFFYTPNIAQERCPNLYEEEENYLNNKIAKFVITTQNFEEIFINDCINKNYELYKSYDYDYNGDFMKLYLYKIK